MVYSLYQIKEINMYSAGPNPNLNSNPNPNPNSFRRVTNNRYANIILFIAGVVLIAFGVFSLFDGEKTKNWPSVQGITQDVDSNVSYDSEGNSKTDYRYVVVYTVDGQSYRKSSTSSSYVNNGESQQVLYNPENPNDTRIGSTGGWTGWITIALGGASIVIGVVLTLRRIA